MKEMDHLKFRTKKGFSPFRAVLRAVCALSLALCCTLSASAALEDWGTTNGILKKSGNDTDGYSIINDASAGYGAATYEVPVDIMSTQLRFKFTAIPADESLTESWAYISFTTDIEERGILFDPADSQSIGRIELLLWQRANGTFELAMYQGGVAQTQIVVEENFDFSAEHTLAFTESISGDYLVFDGIPYSSTSFQKYLDFHKGGKKTYIRVGGHDAFTFTDLKIETITPEESEEPVNPNLSEPDIPSHFDKLGDLAESETESSVPSGGTAASSDTGSSSQGLSGTVIGIIIAGSVAAVCLIAALIILICLKARKKSKNKTEEDPQ